MLLSRYMLSDPRSGLRLSPKSKRLRWRAICWICLIVLTLAFMELLGGCKRSSSSSPKQARSIHEAAATGDEDAIKRFLAEGVSPNASGEMGWTPLHIAARDGYSDVVGLLLAQGADLEVRDKNGMTALHWAAGYGSLETVKVLVGKGANVNAKNKYGGTPLGATTMGRGQCEEVALLLLSKGADANAKDSDGSTVLHKAVLNGEPGVLRILIENGADPAGKDKDGKTPLDRARAISQAKFRRGTIRAKKKPQFEMCVQILEDVAEK